jgi:putative transposase
MKTLKAEEVNGKAYATPEQARRAIGAFIEAVYNSQRLHSALGYKPPVAFEAELDQSRNRQPEAEAALSPN